MIPHCCVPTQVGFGKGTASKQLWLDGIDPTMPESQLERQLSKYGRVSCIICRSMVNEVVQEEL